MASTKAISSAIILGINAASEIVTVIQIAKKNQIFHTINHLNLTSSNAMKVPIMIAITIGKKELVGSMSGRSWPNGNGLNSNSPVS